MGGSSTLKSFRIQARVIGALLMREILTRYGRHNIGFLWLFIEPMLFTVGVAALWTATKSVHGSNLPIVAFAVTGYSSVLLWRNMPSRCIVSITPNLALMFHRNVRVIDIFLSRLILEGAGATISFIVLTMTFHFLGWMDWPEDVGQVIFAWLMTAWFGISVAMFLGALSERTELIEKLWHPASYLIFPLSGAAFMVEILPPEAQKVILWIPMIHGVECLREGFFGSRVHAHYDLAYMGIVNSLLLLCALSQIRIVGRYVIPA